MVVLSKRVTLRKNFFEQGTGLMFTKRRDDFAYVFPFKQARSIGITMMFVFYPIDVIFLLKGQVVEIKKKLKPFGFYQAKKLADTFIEIPAGKSSLVKLGDTISWNSKIVEIADKTRQKKKGI